MILFSCSNYGFILKIVAYVFKLLQIAAPIALIVYTIFDFFKAFSSGEEKVSKEVLNKVWKRLMYVFILILLPILIKYIFRVVGRAGVDGYGTDNSPTSWIDCFNQYF